MAHGVFHEMELKTVMAGGHIVFGFNDHGQLSTIQFLPDSEGVDLLPRCTIEKCSAFVRRDGTLDVIISKYKQKKE